MRGGSMVLAMLVGLGLLGGCQGARQIIDEEQATAMAVSLRRARSEMACPAATGAVLSAQTLRSTAWGGQEQSQYVVGVTGCGRRVIYVSICQLGSLTCLAVSLQVPIPPGWEPVPPPPRG